MGTFSHSAGDLGQMSVHRLGVGEGQHEARSCGASGADGTEDVAPLVPRVALGPDAGESALRADPRFILEPYVQRLVPRPCGDRRRYRPGEVF